jgi:tetratricopeptide (TPR) repeat protein
MSTVDAGQLQQDGLRLFEEGSYDQALETFERAREAYVQSGEALLAGEMLNNIGVIHRLKGRHQEALEALESAREMFGQAGDRGREAQTLGNLGGLHAARNDYEAAVTSYRRAIEIFDDLGEGDYQGETYMALGLLQFKHGKRTDGLAAYEAGLLTVKHPTLRQRSLRTLLKLRHLLLGG